MSDTFERFACWEPRNAETMMETEALQTPNHVFLATHYPSVMYRKEHLGAIGERYEEKTFLRDFLRHKDFMLVPVLGHAGTGKSHLVRWLYTQIKESPKRRVLMIPKIDTNLKKVLEKIVGYVAGEKQEEYRQRLRRVSSGASEDEACERLLDNLAIAVGPYRNDPAKCNETQAYLMNQLPTLLHDAVFRRALLKKGGIVRALIAHILGIRSETERVERLEARRQFMEADMPDNVVEFGNAGKDARELYSMIMGPGIIRKETVEWLNAHLDESIAGMLNFSGEDLLQLMNEVRATLEEQEQELVILIEDFAKLQGIDTQLLEALLVQRKQEGHKTLCVLRTALACTTGYYRNLPETVKDRVSFIVDMDVNFSADTKSAMRTYDDIARFSALYLNAARVGEARLKVWFETDSEMLHSIPNACDVCPFRTPCHTAFGQSDGYGLYPFNTTALQKMTDSSMTDSKEFNPRVILNKVLKHVLVQYCSDIRNGRFPTGAMPRQFGKSKLNNVVAAEIEAKDNPIDSPRRKALLEFWSNATEAVNLDPVIHTAFALKLLPEGKVKSTWRESPTVLEKKVISPIKTGQTAEALTQAADKSDETRIEKPPLVEPSNLSSSDTQLLEALASWGSSTPTPLALAYATKMRDVVFPAVESRINWDHEFLLKPHFCENKWFQKNSVYFDPQLGQNTRDFRLTIPGKHSRAETSLALQGLWLFQQSGNWHFTYKGQSGAYYFKLVARHVEIWAADVVAQLHRLAADIDLPAELLALGGAMTGQITNRGMDTESLINGMFAKVECRDTLNSGAPPKTPDAVQVDSAQRTRAWKMIVETFCNYRESIAAPVLAALGCTKGGSPRIQIIDIARLWKMLERFRENVCLVAAPPKPERPDFTFVLRMRETVEKQFDVAVTTERERLMAAGGKIAETLEGQPRNIVIEAVKQAALDAQALGTFPEKPTKEELAIARERFGKAENWDVCVETLERIQKEASSPRALLDLGRNIQAELDAFDAFSNASDEFLRKTEDRVQSNIATYDKASALDGIQKDIEEKLELLQRKLEDVKGNPLDSNSNPTSERIARAPEKTGRRKRSV